MSILNKGDFYISTYNNSIAFIYNVDGLFYYIKWITDGVKNRYTIKEIENLIKYGILLPCKIKNAHIV